MSPSPTWNLFFDFMTWFGVFHLMIAVPATYIFLGRPFDKRFTILVYTIEKDLWFFSTGVRLSHYASGIVMQPYRDKTIKNRVFCAIVKRRFIYQDRMYGKVINFREQATKFQIILSCIFLLGFVLLLFKAFLLIFHDFVLYPDAAKARMYENY